MTAMPSREAGFFANTWLIARREFRERVRGRLFFVSTALLAVLAVGVALTPILVKLMDRGTTTTIAVVSADDDLTPSSIQIIGGILNPTARRASRRRIRSSPAAPGDDAGAGRSRWASTTGR